MELKTQRPCERIVVNIDNFNDGRGDIAIISYTPHKGYSNYEHIKLDKVSAKQLHEWLSGYLLNNNNA